MLSLKSSKYPNVFPYTQIIFLSYSSKNVVKDIIEIRFHANLIRFILKEILFPCDENINSY
jgi:hypothetical protein